MRTRLITNQCVPISVMTNEIDRCDSALHTLISDAPFTSIESFVEIVVSIVICCLLSQISGIVKDCCLNWLLFKLCVLSKLWVGGFAFEQIF